MTGYLPWAIGMGAASAALYGTLLLGGVAPGGAGFGVATFLIPYFAQVPLFLAGLWLGLGGLTLAALTAAGLLLVAGGVVFTLVFLVVNAAPALVLVRQALLSRGDASRGIEWYPAPLLLAWLVGLALGAFVAATFLLALTGVELEPLIVEVLATAVRADAAPEVLRDAAQGIARILPGVVGASWMLMVMVNAVLAQSIAVHLGRNLRPSPDMASLALPSSLGILFAISLAGSLMPGLAGFLGLNMVLLLAAGFALAGLGVVHTAARRWPNRRAWLTAVYVFLFLFGWPVIALAGLGLVDPWLNLRQRIGGGPAST